jgi:hypothetical protein
MAMERKISLTFPLKTPIFIFILGVGRIVVLTTAPVTRIYKSVGASFCKITSSLGGKYSAFISETFNTEIQRHGKSNKACNM